MSRRAILGQLAVHQGVLAGQIARMSGKITPEMVQNPFDLNPPKKVKVSDFEYDLRFRAFIRGLIRQAQPERVNRASKQR